MTTMPLPPRPTAPRGTLGSASPVTPPRRRFPVRPAAALGGALVTAAGVLALNDTGDGASGPRTPRWAVEAYFAAALGGDADAHWDLMCRAEQEDVGPREEYLRSLEELSRTDPDELFRPYVVGMHPAGPTDEDGVAVDVVMRAADGSGWSDEVLVVWERGGFRVCGVA